MKALDFSRAFGFKRSYVNLSELTNGGDEGARTPGLGIANAALSQLSYIPEIPAFSRRLQAPGEFPKPAVNC